MLSAKILLKYFIFTVIALLCHIKIKAQYSSIYHQDSEVNSWYLDTLNLHSSMQPFYILDTEGYLKSTHKNWIKRKLFDEHLVQVSNEKVKYFIDFYPDIYFGKDLNNNRSIANNTRGFRLNGLINKSFSFDLQIYENQMKMPKYLEEITLEMGSVPGQGWHKTFSNNTFDYNYSMGHIAYKKGDFHFQMGNDKLFIGDGYRSLLLSDISVPYPFFRANFENKRVLYSAIYMQHIDKYSKVISPNIGFNRKWAVMHFMDINVTKKLTIGLFDAVVWQDADSSGKRGFEMQYANPIIFLRSAEYMNSSTDNAIMGLNIKYNFKKGFKTYFQFVLDEFKSEEVFKFNGWWANKYGFQLGFKGNKILRINNLNGFSEFNIVRPFTYSHKSSLTSYTNFNDALAHPIGSNFIESVSRLEYKYKKIFFYTQINFSRYGLDSMNNTNNIGKNIFKSYDTRDSDYGNSILQGISGKLLFLDFRTSYLINPLSNLRFEIGFIRRVEQVENNKNITNILTFGVRSSFRNLYFDR
jgi:hypothetical protein